MCGIAGIYAYDGMKKKATSCFMELMENLEMRGRDSFGYFTYPSKKHMRILGSVTQYTAVESNFKKLKKDLTGENLILTHCRAKTQGDESKEINNHPFQTEDFVLAHNGVIWNDRILKQTNKLEYDVDTDSYIILALIQKYYNETLNVIKSIQKTTLKIKGSYACWLFHKKSKSLYLFRYNNPLVMAYAPELKSFIFSSTYQIMDFLEDKVRNKKYSKDFKFNIVSSSIDSNTIYHLDFKKGVKKYIFKNSKQDNYPNWKGWSYSNINHKKESKYKKDKIDKSNIKKFSQSETKKIFRLYGLSLLNNLINRGIGFILDPKKEKIKVIFKEILDSEEKQFLRSKGFSLSPIDSSINLRLPAIQILNDLVNELNIRENKSSYLESESKALSEMFNE